jgi:TolB-like protein/class 3 adenylate cyclase
LLALRFSGFDPLSDIDPSRIAALHALICRAEISDFGGILTGERVERRLAAVLAADVAGYSRLMGADEIATLAALKAHRREVVDPTIHQHNGRIVKTTGDGLLVEFASAVDAVTCAMAVQEKMAGRYHYFAPKIAFRIGINIGDIIIDDGDIFGDGVNVAARVENECEPGSVCLSGNAFEQVRGKTGFAFDDLGERSLKNIDRPVRLYAARAVSTAPIAGAKSGAESTKPLALPDKPSIAVLPFQNMSGDPEQEYFADGIVEDIITALSRFKSLFVIARNSSFTYKGKAVDIKQVGRDLGVRYVLEGSVRKSGSKVRITGQLIDAAMGVHLWGDRFDGELKDIFELQDQVTSSVVGAIAPRVEQAEIERARSKPTDSLDAYDHFLRGMTSFNEATRKGIEDSLKSFMQAIELDPSYAAPYSWAIIAYARRRQGLWMADVNAEITEGMRLSRAVIEMGKDDAVALCAGGFGLAFLGGELDAGLALTDRALALNPNLAVAWMSSGWVRSYVGEPETALKHLAHGMRLSPLDVQMFQFYMAASLAARCAGQYEESAAWATKILQERPDYAPALWSYAIASALAGRIEDARSAMSRVLKIDPSIRLSKMSILTVLRRSEDRSRFCEGARLAGMPE